MPIRNPFTRRSGIVVSDDRVRSEPENFHPGFERVDTVGSKASSALSIGSSRSHDAGEYKMSVVNDSGVYLPPSPTEEKGQWPRKYSSRASMETGSSIGEIEQFPISRESFDSYRRSFDITARSPIVSHDSFGRQSLDSGRFSRLPRSALAMDRRFQHQPSTTEELFEDVGLEDQKQVPRKRGFFSKLTDSQDASGPPTVSRFLMPGRKRGHSGQGAELNPIILPKDN